MKVLHLILKKKWFDMIASGEKKQEYREIKDYWSKRLNSKHPYSFGCQNFDVVRFRNGYAKDAPKVTFVFNGSRIDYGNKDWGAEPGKKYFVIELGAIIK